MITMNESTTNTDRVHLRQRRRIITVATITGCLLVATAGCSGSLMHNYGSFKSADTQRLTSRVQRSRRASC
jgi:hypothetical protein